ncbi:hypothetical protein [Desulfovibrio aminophilus]|uniref:hypothetical protein n=1 Tax=Desulfovibrio aminophilus TaxID=81425 RepID=UPI0033977A2E
MEKYSAMEIVEAEGYEIDVHIIDGELHHFMTIPALVRLYDLIGKPVSYEWRKEVAFLAEGIGREIKEETKNSMR